MIDNPYSTMIELFRQEGAKYNAPELNIGVVLTEEPNLTIESNGIQLDKDNLYIADYLLSGYKRSFKSSATTNINGGSVNGSTNKASVSEHGSHSHSINNININGAKCTASDGQITYEDRGLRKGDLVAMQQINKTNKFVVYCKVVSL